MHFVADDYRTLRRYTPAMLNLLNLKAAPSASDLLQAIKIIQQMNNENTRSVPSNAPLKFIPKRWKPLVLTNGLIDRHYYEICALTQLKAALRSGDIYITGSRQFKDFDDYMMPLAEYRNLEKNRSLPVSIDPRCESYLEERLLILNKNLGIINDLASKGELPDALISESGLRVSSLKCLVPYETELLASKVVGLLPHIKITDLLAEVDQWTGFTKQSNHLKTGKEAPDRTSLLTTVLADAINLGLSKMSETCPGTTYSKLAWLQAGYVRDETYSGALSEIVNFQSRHPYSDVWGDGTISSSNGQNFKVGARGSYGGRVNLKYGQKAGSQIYIHISDQYAPYYVQNISTTIRDSTHVLDGLLYHESELRIEEHYTDTAGFTDHVFALTHLLGFRFAPRIRDLNDKRLFVSASILKDLPVLSSMIGQKLNIKLIEDYWDDILRLASSIRQGSVTASLILRKLGSYPMQNGRALALREFGRLERTLFMLEWIQSPELRRRVQVGLNKGEARNALARAVFFNQLGEIRDRSFEQQRYRASGLNLVTAAIVLWNTIYLEKAVETLRKQGIEVDDKLLQHISPLGWEHIALTGEYRWPSP
ncbi:Mobile element protein [Candidatus Enterovibrio escicola]|uniref:Mobile element protein n=1 Tax=Candidatus Enterovibrio escicola TaxID=1927127 RepID=A0A2A5SZ81_9GAMM|nr:Mobile element protein [Candidatus Enterovibrio escacola]